MFVFKNYLSSYPSCFVILQRSLLLLALWPINLTVEVVWLGLETMWVSDQEHDLGHVNVSSPSATTLVCPWSGPQFLSLQNGGSLLLAGLLARLMRKCMEKFNPATCSF